MRRGVTEQAELGLVGGESKIEAPSAGEEDEEEEGERETMGLRRMRNSPFLLKKASN